MASTLTQIVLHVVFHTKPKRTNIRDCDLTRLFEYIAGVVNGLGGATIQVGGMPDHVHILMLMTKNMSVADFVKEVKISSSKWLRTIDMHFYNAFNWQSGYGAFSVSPSLIETTRNYIANQAQHHRNRSSFEELRYILRGYGVKYDERYLFDE